MNRLQYVDLSLENRYSKNEANAANRCDDQYRANCNARQFIPVHYEKNYAYPLIVWLHGPTGSECEINQVMPHISVRNYLGVSPRGVVEHPTRHPNGDATYTWNQNPQSIEWAIDDVVQCISSAKQRFNIAPDRIFLVGNDTGGTMALRIALAMPQLFAGVASIGGSIPDSSSPMAGFLNAREMPVLLIQGRESDQYTQDTLCSDIRLLHSAGMKVNVRQYPCGQEVTTKMLSDLNVWLMERVTGTTSQTVVYDDPTRLRSRDFN